MNMSSRYKRSLSTFLRDYANKATWPNVADFDNNNFFCYIKNTPILTPTINPTSVDRVVPLLLLNPEVNELNKAESILYELDKDLKKFELEGRIYYACSGYIFNSNKTPIVITCTPLGFHTNTVLCFDYSVIENQKDPMNKFIMRKFLPSIIAANTQILYAVENIPKINYTFMNCKSFIVKPTFQGELDHELVGKFLAEKVFYDFATLE